MAELKGGTTIGGKLVYHSGNSNKSNVAWTADTLSADTYFYSIDTAAVFGTTGAGTVYIRPAGYSSSTDQSTFTTSLATIGTNFVITAGTSENSGTAKLGLVNHVGTGGPADYLYSGFAWLSDSESPTSRGQMLVMKQAHSTQSDFSYGHLYIPNSNGAIYSKSGRNATDATAAATGTWRMHPYASGLSDNRVVTASSSESLVGESNLTFDSSSRLNVNGHIRSQGGTVPASGAGLEMYWTGTAAYIHPYDRTTPGYEGELNIRGTVVRIDAGAAAATTVYSGLDISSSGFVFNEGSLDMDFRVESDIQAYSLYMRGSDAKIGMGECGSETEATYKMLNIRFYEANSAAKLTSVGAQASNDGILIYNDYTVTGHASIDFVCDTNYPTGYNAARFGFYGYGNTSTSYNYFFWTGGNNTTTQWETMRLLRDGNLHTRANMIAYSTTITSDERLKQNIVNLEDNTFDKVMKLRPVTFEWKDETKRGTDRVAGLIAQEVEELFPELIYECTNLDDENGPDETMYKHIRYNELIPYLTKVVQEQQKQINELKEKINN